MRQHPYRPLGALLTTILGVAGWFNLLNFVVVMLIGWNSYQEKLTALIPWLNIQWVFIGAAILLFIAVLVHYLVIQPSIMAFNNQQAYEHESPTRADLKVLKNDMEKIKRKLNID